jgi:hypothetical protein
MKISEPDGLFTETIKMRCLEEGIAVAGQITITLVVGDQEDNIVRKGFSLEPTARPTPQDFR